MELTKHNQQQRLLAYTYIHMSIMLSLLARYANINSSKAKLRLVEVHDVANIQSLFTKFAAPHAISRSYHENIVEHYENPRNVGSFDKNDVSVGTVSLLKSLSDLLQNRRTTDSFNLHRHYLTSSRDSSVHLLVVTL
jgi:hypothetical protein